MINEGGFASQTSYDVGTHTQTHTHNLHNYDINVTYQNLICGRKSFNGPCIPNRFLADW